MIKLTRFILRLTSLPVIIVLLVFNLRRLALAVALFFIREQKTRVPRESEQALDVLVLVSCRNEEQMIPELVESLAAIQYPREHLQGVLIDDGSTDGTRAAMEEFSRSRSNWHVVSHAMSMGKARALNGALQACSFGELVYVLDADHRPAPSAVGLIARYFQDERVAGVSGRTIPVNSLASPSAYYSTVETFVHQMLTMRAKDRLGLAPALLGSNCAYRRSALEASGCFRGGALLEDSDLTMTLTLAGYSLHFAPEAIAYDRVPGTVRGYLAQHARWGRGFNDVARDHALALLRADKLSLPMRAELILFALGYLDRLALLGAGLLTLLSLLDRRYRFPRSLIPLALLTPLVQIVALFAEQRVSPGMWVRLPFVPLFLALDIFAAVRAALDSLLNRSQVWDRTDRT